MNDAETERLRERNPHLIVNDRPPDPPPPPSPPLPHVHDWRIGAVTTESDWANMSYHPVVYLLCGCGATKRSVPE
jgi:hypothetical protein